MRHARHFIVAVLIASYTAGACAETVATSRRRRRAHGQRHDRRRRAPGLRDRARRQARHRRVAPGLHPRGCAEARAQFPARRSPRPAVTTRPGSSPGASGASCAIITTSCACASSRRRRWRAGSTSCSASTTTASASATNSRSSAQLTDVGIADELTEFAVAEPATAWWIPAGEWNRYEYLYKKTPLAEVGQAHTPITIRTASGLHLAIHEAALVDYASMWLRRSGAGQRLKAALSPAATGAPRAAARAVHHAVAHDPDRDRRRRALHVRPDPQPQRAERARRRVLVQAVQVRRHLVGAAPRHGDWGTGSEARRDHREREALHRFRRGERLPRRADRGLEPRLGRRLVRGRRATSASPRPTPDFDLEAVAAYAKKHGVHLDRPPRDRRQRRALRSSSSAPRSICTQRLGIDSVKTGYVADAGGIQAHGTRTATIRLRMARRPVHVAPSPQGRDRGREAPHRGESARADQGHGPAAHLPELGRARRRARHGIQRLGQSAESARARGEPRLHAHARGPDGFHAGRALASPAAAARRSSRRSRSSSRSTS